MRPAPWGVNMFGYVTGTFGQAHVTREMMRVMDRRGVPMCYRDMSVYDARNTTAPEFPQFECRGREMPYAVNVFSTNPPAAMLRMYIQWAGIRPEKRFNAIVPFWELPVLTEEWKRGLGMMDVVLAPSEFVASTIHAELPDVPLIPFPQAVFLPDGIVGDRTRWNLPEGRVVFLVAFDVTSDIERKNPWAAIDAFCSAFQPNDEALLLIKLNIADAGPEHARLLGRLRVRVAEREDLQILDSRLAYDDLLSLYASCDVLVSLHRAEGLGLVLMEAMSLGKPVVCTGWSGNMDFTTEENACLVPYRLVPAVGTHDSYRVAGFPRAPEWAEPDADAAAEWMRTLADDPGLRERLGSHARSDMEARRREYARGDVFDRLREFWENEELWSARHPACAAAMRANRTSGWLDLARRAPRALLRRMAPGSTRRD